MRNKIFDKLIEIYDSGSLSMGTLISITVVVYFVANRMSASAKFWVIFADTLVMLLGLIVQILREDRTAKQIKTYLFGTLILAFIATIAYFLNKYGDNIVIGSILVGVFILVFTIIIIAATIFVLRNKDDRFKKSQKIFFVVFSICLIAILIVFVIAAEKKIRGEF
ncbi:hypothetical protein [Clostridium felsineum]|uniref:Uncharacterized protein n=1 Tax=Clostridium felsineum TaxID=36839 RepID=A0A1S8L1Y4_9CLOT|nr:hypothetical protein [Clostridium felsineum]URZ01864.1 hypothetical protein CLAUR_018610 [Clostridium felsineum]URZ05298.1 hypothetical protein CLROS_006220 [Clostridium felsineum]URZ10339.1 hypothetical protein CROST_010470 [Clostridium felsineum]